MPAHDVAVADSQRAKSRFQIIGPPNFRKTSCVETFPPPRLVIGCPGEKNTAILQCTSEQRVRVWEPLDWSKPQDWRAIRDEFKLETASALVGKLGPAQTIVFDGCHKWFDVLKSAADMENVGEGGKPDGRRAWPQARRDMLEWVSMGYYSSIPIVIWIVWSTAEKDDPLAEDGTRAAAKKSIWPDYMGAFQRTAVGETSIIYQFLENEKAWWQLRPDAQIKGIGLRLSPAEAEKLPYRIEAKWPELAKVLNLSL